MGQAQLTWSINTAPNPELGFPQDIELVFSFLHTLSLPAIVSALSSPPRRTPPALPQPPATVGLLSKPWVLPPHPPQASPPAPVTHHGPNDRCPSPLPRVYRHRTKRRPRCLPDRRRRPSRQGGNLLAPPASMASDLLQQQQVCSTRRPPARSPVLRRPLAHPRCEHSAPAHRRARRG